MRARDASAQLAASKVSRGRGNLIEGLKSQTWSRQPAVDYKVPSYPGTTLARMTARMIWHRTAFVLFMLVG